MASYLVTTLDDETAATTNLATEMADGNGLSLHNLVPSITVLGECCGTGHRHIAEIAKAMDGVRNAV